VLLVLVLALVATTQWLRVRPDPAAEPGLRVAVLLLMQADARITTMRRADLGARAERAALVRTIWDDASRADRLARAEQADRAAQTATGRGARQDAGVPQPFVVSRWENVAASARRGQVRLVGHYRHFDGLTWRDDPDRVWQVWLTREDPVGRTRGWHLVTIA